MGELAEARAVACDNDGSCVPRAGGVGKSLRSLRPWHFQVRTADFGCQLSVPVLLASSWMGEAVRQLDMQDEQLCIILSSQLSRTPDDGLPPP